MAKRASRMTKRARKAVKRGHKMVTSMYLMKTLKAGHRRLIVLENKNRRQLK